MGVFENINILLPVEVCGTAGIYAGTPYLKFKKKNLVNDTVGFRGSCRFFLAGLKDLGCGQIEWPMKRKTL